MDQNLILFLVSPNPFRSFVDAYRPSQGKRALRCRASPLQARRRENRPPHGASRARVLREADRGAQAQACRRGEAPLQAHARADAAAQALLASDDTILAASRLPSTDRRVHFGKARHGTSRTAER